MNKWFHCIRAQGKLRNIIILMAFVSLALNLRSPLTSISPIISNLQIDLGMSSATAGLLTTIPILCFGLLAPFASSFIGRMGIEIAITTTLVGIVVGTVVRSIDGIALALLGTVILGASLTIGNIVSIMVIARYFSHRSNMVTGVYTSALNIGTMLTSALTAPLAIVFGWRFATILWVVLAVVAGVLWGIVFLQSRSKAKVPSTTSFKHQSNGNNIDVTEKFYRKSRKPVWKRQIVWLLVIAFAAHLFLYYAITAWLPTYLIETSSMNATSAGIAASAFQILALIGAFGVPALAASGRISNVALLISIAYFWLVLQIGLFIAPSLWPLWALIGGIAQGGGFTILFMLIVDHSYDIDDNRKVSSIVQGVGYSIASLGPMVMGGLHQYFEQWLPSFIFLAVIAMILLAVGIFIAKESYSQQNKVPSQSYN